MSNQFSTDRSSSASIHPPRHAGIVLLVVLGMLTLFSVLGVSYLVFTSRQRVAAFNINRAEQSETDPTPLINLAVERLLVGSNGPSSALWGHDLLGDLYGMRDAVQGNLTSPNNYVIADDLIAPSLLHDGFVRIPTDLFRSAVFIHQRQDITLDRAYPRTPATPFARDEELSGRVLTFNDGPLAGLSFRIVRYFGDHRGAINNRPVLSGQLVLDLRPHYQKSVTIDSIDETRTLLEWINRAKAGTTNISLLFYNQIPTVGSGATPLSNFYINGQILNGPGLGWDKPRDNTLGPSSSKYNLNETINVTFDPRNPSPSAAAVKSGSPFANSSTGTDIPVPLQGNFALYRRDPTTSPSSAPEAYLRDLPSGDSDEGYDAPDDQNWWLSYIPSDASLGDPIPSFVRPSLIHWIINQNTDPMNPTTPVALNTLPVARLQQILRALQRATLRPLPIVNDPISAPLASRPNGVLSLDYSGFTGSNADTNGLGSAIDFNETNANVYADAIRRLARALAGRDALGSGAIVRAWDVDNDGDGLMDSVWTDAGLPLVSTDDGRLLKPLVAYLIEDLGGRINVNLAGNLAQAKGIIPKQSSGALYRSGALPTSATITESNLVSGFGYGPAELDIRQIFLHPSVQVGNGAIDLLRRRLNSRRVGGIEYVIAGHIIEPFTDDPGNAGDQSGNDLMGMLRQPNLPNLHRPSNRYGLPVDKFGRGALVLGIDGGLAISGTSIAVSNAGATAGDSDDDPYEMRMTTGEQPDRPFTLTDLEGVLRYSDFDRDTLGSELVSQTDLHFDSNLPNSSSTVNAARKKFTESITTESNSATTNVGMLPAEFRDQAGTTFYAQSAMGAKDVVTEHAIDKLNPMANEAAKNAILMQLLPRSILAGEKLDLNRPFGNGIDDDSDGVIDDPEELRSTVEAYYRDFTGGNSIISYTTQFSDVTNGVPGPTLESGTPFNEPSPQSLFARHLYVLAMALTRNQTNNDVFDFSNGIGISIDASNRTYHVDSMGAFVVNNAQDEYRAWRLAQWAINVADFRDPDGIMSRFEYDVYPFDGWDIDSSSANPKSRVVWGLEYPELALEESLAFHRRNVRDTNLDPTMEPRFQGASFRDTDPDQYRLPQGSLYLEIRNTRSPDFLRVPTSDSDTVAQSWSVPAELYAEVDINGGSGTPQFEYVLDLSRTAPDRNPVWRIAVSRAHPSAEAVGATDPELSPDELLQPVDAGNTYTLAAGTVPANRLTATLDPSRPNFFGPQVANAVERVIWFTTTDPDLDSMGNRDGMIPFAPLDSRTTERVFYNRFPVASYPYRNTALTLDQIYLRGNQYAVIGPRDVVYLGALDAHGTGGPTHDPTTSEPLVPFAQYESPQRFVLAPTAFQHRLFTNTLSTPTIESGGGIPNASMRPVVGILAAANPPTGWTGPNVTTGVRAIGLNVSEPLPYYNPVGANRYYDPPTESLKAGFPTDSWRDYANATGNFPDVPFDSETYSELYRVFGTAGQQTGTRERFKTAYLQRLADPTQPYNATLNPYISIDYITIDLTVFNGSEDNRQETDSSAVTQWIDEADADPFGSAPTESFATRYKSGTTIDASRASGGTENLTLSVNTIRPATTGATPVGQRAGHTPYFPITLSLQDSVNPDAAGSVDATASRTLHSSTLGYANASYGERWKQDATTPSNTMSNYIGMPYNRCFTNVNWLNRPFVSPLELMWVPATSPGRLGLSTGSTTVSTGYVTAGNMYGGTGNPVGTRFEYNRMYPFLWNFFSGNDHDFQTSPNLGRMLEWVTVPEPFDFASGFLTTNRDVLTNAYANSTAASAFGDVINYSNLAGGPTATSNPNTWVNANSAFWLNQWTIEAYRTPFNFLESQYRQGRVNLNTIKNERVFAAVVAGSTNGFDSSAGAFFGPFVTSRRGYTASGTDPEPIGLNYDRRHASDFAGAFRPSSLADVSAISSERSTHSLSKSLLRPGGVLDSPTNEPLFQRPLGGASGIAEWRERSVAHQQLDMTRLSNLVCDQSNVFGVWITIGHFEVNTATMSVGAEAGSDLGKAKRYRSFHIIDRAIPVKYEPGVLNNAMETVQLSRRLQ